MKNELEYIKLMRELQQDTLRVFREYVDKHWDEESEKSDAWMSLVYLNQAEFIASLYNTTTDERIKEYLRVVFNDFLLEAHEYIQKEGMKELTELRKYYDAVKGE